VARRRIYFVSDVHASERCWLKFLGGIPLMTICGVLGIPFLAFIAYRTATDKALGANARISLIVNGVLIAVGFGWFYALRWYRRSRGENVDRRFEEIPIDNQNRLITARPTQPCCLPKSGGRLA
jgi:uncharacterized membrane protein